MALLLNTNDIVTAVNYRYKTTVVDEGKNYFNPNGEYVKDINCYRYFISGLNPDKQYVCSTDFNSSTSNASIYFNGTSSVINGVWSNKPIITKPNSNGTLFVQTRFLSSDTDAPLIADKVIAGVYHIQIEEGSTPTEFEPYRPPIETTIYHDEPYFTGDYVRKDKDGGAEHKEWVKLILTGDELINKNNVEDSTNYLYYINNKPSSNISHIADAYCSHLPSKSEPPIREIGIKVVGTVAQGVIYLNFGKDIMNAQSSGNTPLGFKEYLKNEYNNGTPVNIFYLLKTPTDTPKDLPEILLVNGYNGIDTDTQIKPEKMSITYKATKERAEYDLQLTNNLLDVMKGM